MSSLVVKLPRPLNPNTKSTPSLNFNLHCIVDTPPADCSKPSSSSSSSSTTILFLHGIYLDSRIFKNQIPVLTGAGYKCIRYDHRGQGQSTIDPETAATTPFDVTTLKLDLIDVIDKVSNGEKVHLVGHSMGGMVAMRVAFERPDLVASLTLLSSNSVEGRRKFSSVLALKVFSCLGPRAISGSLAKAMFGSAFLQNPENTEEKQQWLEHLSNLTPTAMRVGEDFMVRPSFNREFSEIKVPILVMAGSEDKSAGPKIARTLERLHPGCDVKIIDRAGHAPQIEQSAAVNSALLEFLSKL